MPTPNYNLPLPNPDNNARDDAESIADAFTLIDAILFAKASDGDLTALAGTVTALAAQKGANNGIATLDGGGKIPESQLPALALVTVSTVANQAAMLALTAEPGDVAVRTDQNKSYILSVAPASTLANWVELRSPTDAVLSVAGKTGAVTLVRADISDASTLGRTLMAIADAAAGRTALGLGTVAVENTVPVSKGGTGATDQNGARTALGIGSNANGAKTISTSSPSGGVDGDIWYKVPA